MPDVGSGGRDGGAKESNAVAAAAVDHRLCAEGGGAEGIAVAHPGSVSAAVRKYHTGTQISEIVQRTTSTTIIQTRRLI